MIKDDIQTYNSRVAHRGFLYFVGLFVIITLSILKALVMICHDIHHRNTQTELPMTNLFRKQYESHMATSDRLGIRLTTESNIPIEDVLEKDLAETSSLQNMVKAQALSKLRDYFLETDVLSGDILQTKFPKVAYEDVYNSYKYGTDCKACVVQHISFGKDMNMLIHEAFGYQLKRKKLTGETFLVFNDGETYDLERTLQETFYCDIIKLRLRDVEPQKPKKVKL